MVQLTGLMRKINGSVRDFTFKRVNGVTVVSEKVTEVTNPRTEAQMRQRCKWTNIAAMYRGIRTLLNKVFQSKEATQSDHNKFTQILTSSRLQSISPGRWWLAVLVWLHLIRLLTALSPACW